MHTCSTILCLRIFSLSMILMATLAPVSTCFAYLTLAKVPSPKVFPISYLPIWVRIAWGVLIFFLADLPPSPSLSLPPFVSFQIKVANLPPQPFPSSFSSSSSFSFSFSLSTSFCHLSYQGCIAGFMSSLVLKGMNDHSNLLWRIHQAFPIFHQKGLCMIP